MAEYAVFKKKIRRACASLQEEEDPHLVAIQKAMPAVADRLRTLTGQHQAGTDTVLETLKKVQQGQTDVLDAVRDFAAGSFVFSPGKSRILPRGFDSALLARPEDLFPPPPPPPPPAAFLGAPPGPALSHSKTLVGDVPSYKLSRDVYTVPELWREWTVGLQGLPSVDELNRLFEARWRPASERQYYSSRKVIVDEIRRRATGAIGATMEARLVTVVEEMEEQRKATGASLDKVYKTLKAAAKQVRED